MGLDMFETRTEAWEAAGLQLQVDRLEVGKARRRLPVLALLLAAVVYGDVRMEDHFYRKKHHPPVSSWYLGHGFYVALAVVCVLVLGWLISRDLARMAPVLFRRMDPATAGTVEFLIRFVTVAATALGAFAVAGTPLQTLAVGGAFTAVVVGLAAQQTLGNLFAGMVLLSARPFRLGERVRLQAGAVGGSVEGIVSSLGLLYTTLARGEDRIMIPNNVVLAAAVVPLREPDAVDVRVRLSAGIRPSQVQQMLDANIATETRAAPNVVLEEINGGEVVVRVRATPDRRSDGARLADEIIAVLASVTTEHALLDESDGAPSDRA
jgi:small-conductance mechanosensitive channel